jgi:hypothetical protein
MCQITNIIKQGVPSEQRKSVEGDRDRTMSFYKESVATIGMNP